jgi:hypothetical protein
MLANPPARTEGHQTPQPAAHVQEIGLGAGSPDYPDAKSVIHNILQMGEGKSCLIACLLWRWWTRRNKINAKDNVGDKTSLISQIRFWAGESAVYYSKDRAQTIRFCHTSVEGTKFRCFENQC